MGRCLSPCLGDLDPNLYRERLEGALGLFFEAGDGGRALLAHVEAQMHEASAARSYERAAALRRRHDRLQTLLARLGGVLRVVHAGSRLVVAPHPEAPGRADALWIAGGRVVDWGPAVPPAELALRSARALARAPRAGVGGWLPADAIAETRLVGLWMAAHTPPALELRPGLGVREHSAFLARHGAGLAA
jgi:DNA polymerase-3 subunit epsilon